MSGKGPTQRVGGGKRIRREPRTVLIRAGRVALRARLLSGPIAEWVWSSLPIYASAEVAVGALHFPMPAPCALASRRIRILQAGDIGVCAGQGRIAIAWSAGAVPPVDAGRPPLSCDIWAVSLDDVAALGAVRAGDRIAVLVAES